MSRNTLKVSLAFGILVGAVGYLVFSGLQDTMVYFITVSELQAKSGDTHSKSYRVEGTVTPGTLRTSGDRLEFTFVLEDSGSTMPVRYNGILPDTFKEGMPVLVEGRYTSDGTFVAQQLFTKCPSKYESADDVQTSTTVGDNPS